VLDVEARRLAHVLTSYGPLSRSQLIELCGAESWNRGAFSQALRHAVDRSLIRYLGHGFYAPPRRRPGVTTTAVPGERGSVADGPWISSRDMGLAQSDFERLLELRVGLRRFLSWSEHQAKEVGLTPAKHQLLLAVRGHPDPAGPTISELADYLVLRHHSVVGLVDRAERDGLVKRQPDSMNRSAVRVTLTPAGEAKLDTLTEAHLQEIRHLAPTMRALWRTLGDGEKDGGPRAEATSGRRSSMRG
jgi:DNA-binding MarR family transcriptional regulator